MNEHNNEHNEHNKEKIKKEKKDILGFKRNIFITGASIALLIILVSVGLIYWRVLGSRTIIENATISGPQIDLAATTAGPLEEVFVNEGDQVAANAVLARVGNELIKAKTAGIIINVKKDIGELFTPGVPVVSMIDPNELRVVGQIDENKGLSDIMVGQAATFTVDTFGNQKFTGVVDEIKPSSNDSSVVFFFFF
jgi:multidrug resistance efflux pump